MNAAAFRHLYGYHHTENRQLWAACANVLTAEQFVQPVAYSLGSVRDQIVHLMTAEEVWLCELRGVAPAEPAPEAAADDRAALRARWDQIEAATQAYLQDLSEAMLFTRPITEPAEDKDLLVWQVLLHVVNHATDHRAQLLRVLHDLGVKTTSQDYIFYVFDHPHP